MGFEGKERFPLSLEPWDWRDCTQYRQKWPSLVQRNVPLKQKPTAVMSVHICLLRGNGSENRQEKNRGSNQSHLAIALMWSLLPSMIDRVGTAEWSRMSQLLWLLWGGLCMDLNSNGWTHPAVRIINLIQPRSMVPDPKGVTLRGETWRDHSCFGMAQPTSIWWCLPSLASQVWA